MSGFGFSEAQEMFRREVRSFAQKELAPGAKERAKLERVPQQVVAKLTEAGLVGVSIPEKYGGQGADWVSLGIVAEELSKVDVSAFPVAVMPGIAFLCLQHGSEELRQEWLPRLSRGGKLVCWALTEPDAGSDAAAIKTSAAKKGDHYLLNGEKTSISLGAIADVAMVFAKTDPKARARGVSCFWVPLNLPGISRSYIPHTGLKPWGTGSIVLGEVSIAQNYLVGEEGKGFYITMEMADCARVCLALMALGIAQASLEEAMSYAVQRTAFGQAIARFEGISFKIAEEATLIEAARLLCYRALYLMDQGLPHTKEAAMCKWWCPVVAVNAVHEALLIHGHVGYSEEYPLEQRLRDTIGLEYTDGTAQIMKIVIARELMGRVAVPY